MPTKRHSLLKERTNLGTVVASLLIGLAGVALFWLASDGAWWKARNWWVNATNVQSTLNSLGALLVASVPITLFWELWGKRRFLDEILAKARISKELEDAGITSAYQSFQRLSDWGPFFANTNEIDIFFAYGHSWRNNNREHLQDFLARRHSRLRVVLPDPDDEATVKELARRFSYTEDNMRDRIREAYKDFGSIAPNGKKVEIYYFHGMSPNVTFYRFGDTSVFALYNHNPQRAPVPAFVVRDGGFLYSHFRDEFTAIRNSSRQVFPVSNSAREGANAVS